MEFKWLINSSPLLTFEFKPRPIGIVRNVLANYQNMKFKNSILIIFFLLSISVNGQNYFIGIKAGANFTNVKDNIFDDKEFKTGLCTGLSFDYLFRNKISISSDLLYTQKGFGNYFYFGDKINEPEINGGPEILYFHYNYLSIPIKTGYQVGEKFHGFGNIGLAPSFLINSKMVFENNKSIKVDKVTKFDLAGQIEMGCAYQFKEKINIYSSISYMHSFTYLSNENYFGSGNIRSYGITISLGLKYKIKRK
jgi:hypothetical protein